MPEFSYIELACKKLEVDPDSILSFHEYDDQLAIITAEGKKFVFSFEELESKSVQNIAAGRATTSPKKSSERAPTPDPKKSSERAPMPAHPGGVGSRSRRGTGPPYFQSDWAPTPTQTVGLEAASIEKGRAPKPIQTAKKDGAIEKEPMPAGDSDPAAPAAKRRKIRRPKSPNASEEEPQEK